MEIESVEDFLENGFNKYIFLKSIICGSPFGQFAALSKNVRYGTIVA